ncbi:MAG: sigma 54-interacting transcriptional regulator [Peptococcaceae bacterium]
MIRIRIALIGYKEFIQKAQPFVSNIQNVEIKVFDCFGSETLEIAKNLESYGANIIITGQANYYYLKDMVNIPIVVLKVDFIDIVNALNEAAKHKPNSVAIAFASFDHFAFDLEELCKLINVKAYKISYLSAQELETKIKKAKQDGVRIIIGTTLAVSLAEKLGMTGILIYSIENTILRSIEKAIEIFRINEDIEKRNVSLMTILDNTSEGIISLDTQGRIVIANKVAREILRQRKDECVGSFIGEFITESAVTEIINKGCTEQNKIVKINSVHTTLNIIPIKVKDTVTGGVLTFQDITSIESLDINVRSKMKHAGFTAKYTFHDIKGKNGKMQETVKIAQKYAENTATVMIYGESGTGKELFSQSIHNYGPRRSCPFVAINCASLPENLLESELFGYEPGAFTGADKNGKKGLFEIAHKGTLFLDEIDSIPIGLQGKLLRVIEEMEIIRIGGKSIIPIDVRIIAATNKDLREAVHEGKFRKDLYYRLNVLKIKIPPLRERMDDLPELIKILIKELDIVPLTKIEPYFEIITGIFSKYNFPGNIRELKGVLNRFLVLFNEDEATARSVKSLAEFSLDERNEENDSEMTTLKANITKTEKQVITELLNKYENKKIVAKELGIGRTTLYRKLKNYGLLSKDD